MVGVGYWGKLGRRLVGRLGGQEAGSSSFLFTNADGLQRKWLALKEELFLWGTVTCNTCQSSEVTPPIHSYGRRQAMVVRRSKAKTLTRSQ